MTQFQKASWVCGLLGFIIKFTTTNSSGGVVVHRNWSAMIFGILALLLALISLPESLNDSEYRNQKLGAIGVAILVGVILLAMGFGVFYSG
jgi:hypothetical protein